MDSKTITLYIGPFALLSAISSPRIDNTTFDTLQEGARLLSSAKGSFAVYDRLVDVIDASTYLTLLYPEAAFPPQLLWSLNGQLWASDLKGLSLVTNSVYLMNQLPRTLHIVITNQSFSGRAPDQHLDLPDLKYWHSDKGVGDLYIGGWFETLYKDK